MPRIRSKTFRKALGLSSYLAELLPVCRSLRSAQNELRWIREHVRNEASTYPSRSKKSTIRAFVRRRARGEPLQYLLGSEWFGDLEIKCQPGVLIPRPETAASVINLAHLLASRYAKQRAPPQLRVLDFCTGSGCIPLLFHDEFYKHPALRNIALDIKGYDISTSALKLANENRSMQLERAVNRQSIGSKQASERYYSLQNMQFRYFDVLSSTSVAQKQEDTIVEGGRQHNPTSESLGKALGYTSPPVGSECDILISNPPYISPLEYVRTTARSVRQFEPKLALVPPARNTEDVSDDDQGDLFYSHLLDLAERLSAKLTLLEVADLEQAKRVAATVLRRTWWEIGVNIWRDEPSRGPWEDVVVNGRNVKVVGEGNGRSVFIWRKDCDALGFGVR